MKLNQFFEWSFISLVVSSESFFDSALINVTKREELGLLPTIRSFITVYDYIKEGGFTM